MVNMKSRSSRSSLNNHADDQSVNSADSGKGSANGSNSCDEPMSPNALKLKQQRLQRDAARHREKYKNETEEQRKRRRERDALRHKEAYREKRMQKRIERLEAMYANKEQVPAELGIDTLSPLNLGSPPTKRVRSKGRAASVPNLSSVANHLAALGAYRDTHSRRSSGTIASEDSEDPRSGMYPAFEVLHPFVTSLNSTSASVSSTSASFHVPALESSTSDLGFSADNTFPDSALFMDGLFESYDYNLLPGIDTMDLLDSIGQLEAAQAGQPSAGSSRNCSMDARTDSNCRSESIDSTIESPHHHMPMPTSHHTQAHLAHLPAAHAAAYHHMQMQYGSYNREDFGGRTTRSNTFPHYHAHTPSGMLLSSASSSCIPSEEVPPPPPAPYDPELSVHAVDYSSDSIPFVLSQHPHLTALMQALPPPPVSFVPFNPLPPAESPHSAHDGAHSDD